MGKIGVRVSASSVRKILRRNGVGPAPVRGTAGEGCKHRILMVSLRVFGVGERLRVLESVVVGWWVGSRVRGRIPVDSGLA